MRRMLTKQYGRFAPALHAAGWAGEPIARYGREMD